MEPAKSTEVQKLFSFCVHQRVPIIIFLDFISLSLAAYIISATFFAADFYALNYSAGIWAGRLGIIIYIATLIPGILRRFKIHHPLGQMLMLFRRQTGVLSFMLVSLHGWFNKGLPLILKHRNLFPLPPFSVMGISAAILLFLLFITSNDTSVHKMGRWWERLHQLTYLIVWLVFLHVALIKLSVWSVLIGFFAVLEVVSFLYNALNQKREILSGQK